MGMALLLKALLLKVLLLNFSDQGFLVAWRGQKKWMVDHSGETGLDSWTESQRGTEIGIETGIERETEVLAVEGVHLVMEGCGGFGGVGATDGREKAWVFGCVVRAEPRQQALRTSNAHAHQHTKR